MRFQRLKAAKLLFALTLLIPSISFAQVSFNSPSPAKIKSCDDFASIEYSDQWDMANTADINNYIPGNDLLDFVSYGFAAGKFKGVTTSDNNTLYLFSPTIIGSHASAGRFGAKHKNSTNAFNRFSIRMFTDKADSFGMRTMWNRGRNYASTRTVTNINQLPLKPGWRVYSMDLNAATRTGDNTDPWSAGNIKGFALRPTTQTGASVEIDWVRLEDPTTCAGSGSTVSFTASSSGNDGFYSLYLDDDNNPFNGFITQFKSSAAAAGADSASLSSAVGIAPGAYKFNAILNSDYATLEETNPWDMSESWDIKVASGVSNPTFSNGLYSGVTDSGSPNVFLNVASGISTAKYRYLSFKLSRSDAGPNAAILWNGGIDFVTNAQHVGGDVYQVDLGLNGAWTGTGTVTDFIIRPSTSTGVSFSLDWIALRANGFVTSHDAVSIASGATTSTTLTINTPPTVAIDEPNDRGGVAIRPWNMRTEDLTVFSNLRSDTDPDFPTEQYTTFLPDVRTIDDVRGTLFKGTNTDGSDDPVNYSLFPLDANPLTFSASEYKNLCFKFFIDTPFILTALDGSMARVLWKKQGDIEYESSGAIVAMMDGWSSSRWNEYCVDLERLESDAVVGSSLWNGTITELRVDPHEIRASSTYYFDYIKLRKNDMSTNGKYNIIYNVGDIDDAVTVDLYYNTSDTPSGGTNITTGLSSAEHQYLWDTSGVANGTYYVFALVNDGYNTVRRLASGPVTINNQGGSTNNPILSVESPKNGDTICTTMQVKGFALQPDRFEDVAAVEVFRDGTSLGVIHPSLYNPNAETAHPTLDVGNSGFDKIFDSSTFSAGAHTITVTAYSTDGGETSQAISVNTSNTGCAALVTDPAPSGQPIAVMPNATPTPDKIRPNLKASLSAASVLTLTVTGLSDAQGCTLSMNVGSSTNAVNTMAKSFSLTTAKNQFKAKAKGFKLHSKKLKKLYISATKSCGGSSTTSLVRSVNANKRLKGGSATVAKAGNFLASKLKPAK